MCIATQWSAKHYLEPHCLRIVAHVACSGVARLCTHGLQSTAVVRLHMRGLQCVKQIILLTGCTHWNHTSHWVVRAATALHIAVHALHTVHRHTEHTVHKVHTVHTVHTLQTVTVHKLLTVHSALHPLCMIALRFSACKRRCNSSISAITMYTHQSCAMHVISAEFSEYSSILVTASQRLIYSEIL